MSGHHIRQGSQLRRPHKRGTEDKASFNGKDRSSAGARWTLGLPTCGAPGEEAYKPQKSDMNKGVRLFQKA